jgi:hypothetical protein
MGATSLSTALKVQTGDDQVVGARVRPIVQVIAQLAGATPREASVAGVHTILAWLRDRQHIANIPVGAWSGEPFELDATHGAPLAAERIGSYWALQYDKPDFEVAARTWRTEATVVEAQEATYVGIRLSVIAYAVEPELTISIPRVVGDLSANPGLIDYGYELSSKPMVVHDRGSLRALVDLLEDPKRTRPVYVLGLPEDPGEELAVNATKLGLRVSGIAHVATVSSDMCWELTDRYGKSLSIWGGAVRTYMPGFNPDFDDWTAHPLATADWVGRRFGASFRFVDVLARSAAAISVRNRNLEELLPSFRAVRYEARRKRLDDLAKHSNTSDALTLVQMELDEERKKRELSEQLLTISDEDRISAENERDIYRSQLYALRERIKFLGDELQRSGGAATPAWPESLDQLEEWSRQNIADKVILLPRAIRAAKKSPFVEPRIVYECLWWLAQTYARSRISGMPLDEDGLHRLGVSLEKTGDAAHLRQWEEKYFYLWKGQKRFFELHLKKGSIHDDRLCMRIYFFFDEDDQMIVVGYLPGHLTNNMT